MFRKVCPHCHCRQLVAAVVKGTTVCRYCRQWFKVDRPKTMIADKQEKSAGSSAPTG